MGQDQSSLSQSGKQQYDVNQGISRPNDQRRKLRKRPDDGTQQNYHVHEDVDTTKHNLLPQLPLELVLLILEQLDSADISDRQTLLSVAKTSRASYEFAIPILYKTVSVDCNRHVSLYSYWRTIDNINAYTVQLELAVSRPHEAQSRFQRLFFLIRPQRLQFLYFKPESFLSIPNSGCLDRAILRSSSTLRSVWLPGRIRDHRTPPEHFVCFKGRVKFSACTLPKRPSVEASFAFWTTFNNLNSLMQRPIIGTSIESLHVDGPNLYTGVLDRFLTELGFDALVARITTFSFRSINFTSMGDNDYRRLHGPSIHKLVLHQCHNVGRLLDYLGGWNTELRLKTLEIKSFHETNWEFSTLETFLSCFSDLQKLTVEVGSTGKYNLTQLLKRHPGISDLSLAFGYNRFSVGNLKQIRKLCPNIKTFSCRMEIFQHPYYKGQFLNNFAGFSDYATEFAQWTDLEDLKFVFSPAKRLCKTRYKGYRRGTDRGVVISHRVHEMIQSASHLGTCKIHTVRFEPRPTWGYFVDTEFLEGTNKVQVCRVG
ncbi:hypothetical protein K505DRAFT_340477 [Melanomma pulvis-pyrius CBS 109.77]|uniref:Uncharacterized protein n=1 Tax=Melanomma pulvis-pyrius CBS 109.77 TaxID=1314802 RepID=A0A6A6X1K8_9PLEO|nr:hypothetical protein K505DRAFT_340477 [Melanomma pulvis-pyrius CBS 109.77]